MVDRTDIDALLIGALYGELTPADEARLTAHLESHPADRTALDQLTRTRAAVRDSRILTFQAEPPQSISALLLQEAARRAPRRVDRGETTTWFQRFVRSFMAHPAMAAAATLVLVIAAAGTLYLRGTDQFAQTSAPERAPSPDRVAPITALPSTESAPAAAPSAAPAPEGAEPPAGHATGDSIGTVAGSSAGASAGSSGGPGAGSGVAPAAPTGATRLDMMNSFDQPGDPGAATERAKVARKADQDDQELRKLRQNEAAPARTTKREPVRGLELRTPQLAPKDLGESDKKAKRQIENEFDGEKSAAGQRANAGNRRAASEPAQDQRNAAVAGGGAAVAPAAPPPPPASPPASVPAAPRSAGPASGVDSDLARDRSQLQSASDAKRPPAKPSPSQAQAQAPAANNAGSAQNQRNLGKTAGAPNATNAEATRQAQVLDWARKQHEQVIALVGSNRCREAAGAALEIYNRAPEYFNANVATDRQIKPCLAYVNEERDRAERSRANKNAADVQAPPQAAPVRK
jgi:anti-sigma factor RsiW